jgi:hypothetical protein
MKMELKNKSAINTMCHIEENEANYTVHNKDIVSYGTKDSCSKLRASFTSGTLYTIM